MSANTQNEELKKSLSLFDATMLVAGSMIGSGIFIVSADIARSVGSAGYLLLIWLLSGVLTLIAALSYGELAGMMPEAGGQYVYLHRAYGKVIAFLYGWTVFTVIQTGVIAAVAVAFAKFLAVFFPMLSNDNLLFTLGSFSVSAAQGVAIICILFLTYLNSLGINNGKIIQSIFTSTKIIALLSLIVLGIYWGAGSAAAEINFKDMWSASSINELGEKVSIGGSTLLLTLGVAMIGALFSSDAWNNVTFIAGEIKDPKKNIPRSLLLGTFIVTVLYMLANVAYLYMIPLVGSQDATDVMGRGIQYATNDRVGTAATSIIFGDAGTYVMAALIIISTFGCNNGLILSGARVYFAMAHSGLFFKKAGELNKNNVPGFALWLQCLWASVLCLSGSYGDLLDYVTFASLMFYIITIAGIFVLRKKEPNTPRPYKAFGYPLIPGLYIVLATAICLDLLYFKTGNTGRGLLIVLLGLPVYYFSRGRSE